MHYALVRGRTDSSAPDIWVPMPGFVYDPKELPPGEYLLYEAGGKLTKDECDELSINDSDAPPRTFKYEKRIKVSGGQVRTV